MNYLKNYTISLDKDIPQNDGKVETFTGTTLSKLERLGFEGVDASLEISLFEYGMAWTEKGGEWHFVYRIDSGLFTNASFPSDTDWKREFDWIGDTEPFFSYLGTTIEDMAVPRFEELPFPMKVSSISDYYGHVNVFGESYWEGFHVFTDGRDRVAEYFNHVNGKGSF